MDAGALYASIMESVADGVMAVDHDRRITALNGAAARIVGVARDDAIGRRCFDVLRANVCQRDCPVREAMDQGHAVLNRRVTILSAGGDEIPISISAAPLRDRDGNVIGGVETFRDLSALETLRKQLTDSFSYQDMVGKSAPMRRLFKVLPNVAESGSTVLIEGESGTGKELFARAVHDLSPRRDGPYVIVNCGALPESLLESELFGYRRGAFTDARRDKPGRFDLAGGGSMFLDEVETLSPAIQIKLLRVLENRAFEPLGGTRTVPADVRVIASSNQPLADMVAGGAFRQDLFYRLNVVRLELPPLRARRDDVPLLVDHFVNQFNVTKGRAVIGVTPAVMRLLLEHDYPGNVRELQNVIEHAFALSDGPILDVTHLPASLREGGGGDTLSPEHTPPSSTAGPLAEAEASAIRAVLIRHHGHRRNAARELGISPSTLWRKRRRYGI